MQVEYINHLFEVRKQGRTAQRSKFNHDKDWGECEIQECNALILQHALKRFQRKTWEEVAEENKRVKAILKSNNPEKIKQLKQQLIENL